MTRYDKLQVMAEEYQIEPNLQKSFFTLIGFFGMPGLAIPENRKPQGALVMSIKESEELGVDIGRDLILRIMTDGHFIQAIISFAEQSGAHDHENHKLQTEHQGLKLFSKFKADMKVRAGKKMLKEVYDSLKIS